MWIIRTKICDSVARALQVAHGLVISLIVPPSSLQHNLCIASLQGYCDSLLEVSGERAACPVASPSQWKLVLGLSDLLPTQVPRPSPVA